MGYLRVRFTFTRNINIISTDALVGHDVRGKGNLEYLEGGNSPAILACIDN